MILIFAVDNNWSIGFNGKMLADLPHDLKRFREITEGNIVIMGRKTLEAIPGQNPLPNRINILVTRKNEFDNKGFYIINDLDNLIPLLKEINPDNAMKVFVTGGETIVRQLMPYCNKAYITKIMKSFEEVDTCIPNLDLDTSWKITNESEVYEHNGLKYKYVDYVRSI
ncbi:MAG: dihydrofolate reductase [Tissierellaceae bacterium]|nr:dihydrofolate reductase [Tissierellaceae bacterium]